MNTTISLKELTERYTTADIIRETSKKYTLSHEDAMSLLDLIQKIRNSSDNDSNGMDIALKIAFLGKGKDATLIPYGGFKKNNRSYRFTAKNCCNIEKLSCCNVQIIDQTKLSEASFISEYLPQTDLELLTVILLSINAFSPEIVDCYFDGEAKNADSIAYIWQLIKNNDLPINSF